MPDLAKLAHVLLTAVPLLAAACTRGGSPPPVGPTDSGVVPTDSGTPSADAPVTRPPPPDFPPVTNCYEGAEEVYLLGFDLRGPVLRHFDPSALSFEDRGPLVGCPTGTGFSGRNPWGATLDRDGRVWAHYYEWDAPSMSVVYDRMFTIDVFTGACTDAGGALTHPDGKIFEYGLAFVRDPADPDRDLLYASALGHPYFTMGAELHRVDTDTFVPTMVGPLVGTVHSYLTGTGDGRLISMYNDEGEIGIVELDPATAAPVARLPVTGLPNSQGPFVFWGGAVWVFEMARYEPTALRTDVYRVDLATGAAELVTSVDWIVTASAVSTCAPVELI